MERERKGLFGRLLAFWREKISMTEDDRIGFWDDTEIFENHFAEMGTVAALSQKETKQTFWEETEKEKKEAQEEREDTLWKKEKIFTEDVEVLEERQNGTQEEPVKKSGRKGLFSEGLYQEESVFGKMFQQEIEEEQEKRKIIPVADEQAEQETVVSTEQMEVFKPEQKKRDEKKTVSEVDIEKLMRQMTQKLWEEREGCGRRLR